jgi:hypothetical protein
MPHRDFLDAAWTEKPDVTLQALCDRLSAERGVKSDTSMVSRSFRKIGVTVKKRRLSRASGIAATEAATANDGEPIRGSSTPGAWGSSMKPPGHARGQALDQDQYDPPARLGAKGRAPRRQGFSWPLEDATFLAALRNDRIEAPCLFDGPINGERFHAYVEQFLVPPSSRAPSVLLDNLGSYKGKAVRQTIPQCWGGPRRPAEILA